MLREEPCKRQARSPQGEAATAQPLWYEDKCCVPGTPAPLLRPVGGCGRSGRPRLREDQAGEASPLRGGAGRDDRAKSVRQEGRRSGLNLPGPEPPLPSVVSVSQASLPVRPGSEFREFRRVPGHEFRNSPESHRVLRARVTRPGHFPFGRNSSGTSHMRAVLSRYGAVATV